MSGGLVLALSAAGLPLIYWILMHGLSLSTALWVTAVVAAIQLLTLAVERFANEYVAVDHREPS